jgi:outer membrane lipoprotein SlyB
MTCIRPFTVMLLFTLTTGACVATTTTSQTWVAPPPPAPEWARPGRVEWIRETVQRTQGDPAGGAVAGAIIGALLLGSDGPSTVVGALGGAAVGAAVSQGGEERRQYEMLVRFDDGAQQMYLYQGYPPPFRPGEPVVLTPRGLMRQQ